MGNKSRFIIAESNIKSFFQNGIGVYSADQLKEILENNRIHWNLPAYMNETKFIDRLVHHRILSVQPLDFNGYMQDKTRYMTKDASVFHLALSLINKSYLSHYTAAFLHGLTNQLPKTVYLTFEQSKKNPENRGTLTQLAIDGAFSKPQRKSSAFTIFEDYTILLHNGMFTNRLGVYSLEGMSITNLERTLIDIAVRPAYSGGVDSVLNIYKNAVDKISINKITAILDKLNYIYPYHQVIGFYLEKAGMEEKKLKSLKERPKHYDFYLTYDMEKKEFDANWRLYYSKGE